MAPVGMTADMAYLLGLICARGSVDDPRTRLTIDFRYGGGAYFHDGKRGRIGKGKVSFNAKDVVPLVPATVLARVDRIIAPGVATLVERGRMSYELTIDLVRNRSLFEALRSNLQPGKDHTTLEVPAAILSDRGTLRGAFLVGFGQVCGLASAGTNLFGSREVVWLRPTTANKQLFHQVMGLLESFGVTVWWNDRDERDVSVKVTCEDWQRIGFEVEWLDAIVAEGARINGQQGRSAPKPSRGRLPGTTPVAAVLAPPDPDVIRAGSIVGTREDGRTVVYGIYLAGSRYPEDAVVISPSSPVGRALVGARTGHEVHVQAPGGVFSVAILSVEQPAV